MVLGQLLINGVIAGSIYALIALGFTIIYRTVKFFHFAHGALYTIGAYLAYTLIAYFNVNFILTFFISIGLTALIGIAIDKMVYYPLRQRKASNLAFLIASFGVFIFLQNLISLIFKNRILSLNSGPIEEGYDIIIGRITSVQIMIVIVSILIMLLLIAFFKYSKLGKAMRAVSDDPLASKLVGINPDLIIASSFGIGSALAGAAGILISLETNLEPTMGFSALLKGIIASIIINSNF